MTRVLVVVAPYDFNDKQLVIITSMLLKANIEVMIVNSTGQATKGERGSVITPHGDFYHVDSKSFQGIIFIGGTGAAAYITNRRALQLAKEFFEAGKPVGAIGLSPTILAHAQIIRGKRVTARPTERDVMSMYGQYTGAPVETDGNIITASSTGHTTEFMDAFIAAMKR